MSQILRELLVGALREVAGPSRSQATATFVIPADRRDDPKVQALMRLAADMAEFQRLPSGLELHHDPRPNAEGKILQAIRDVVGAEAFDRIHTDLLARQKKLDAQADMSAIVASMTTPRGSATALKRAVLAGGVGGLTSGDRVRLLNKADAQLATGRQILDQATGRGG